MIHDGVLTALATPAEFKSNFLRGHLLAVTCNEPLRALPLLTGLPGASDVSLYGTSIHVLMREGDGEAIHAALQAAGVTGFTVEPIAPSLDDVFISLMKRG